MFSDRIEQSEQQDALTKLSAEEDQFVGSGDGDSRPLYRFEEGAEQSSVMDGPRQLLRHIDSDAGDADLVEADADLVADSGSGFGVPVDVGVRETIQLRSVFLHEFLLAGRRHGYDGVGAAARHLRREFPAGENQTEEVDWWLNRHFRRRDGGANFGYARIGKKKRMQLYEGD